MTGSTALDVVIGLVFVYLLYSLFATLIQEIIATNLSFRAKILEIAIIRMLNDEKADESFAITKRLGFILRTLFQGNNRDRIKDSLADIFYNQPLIKYLAQDKWHDKPSYLNSSNFSKTIVDLLRGNDPQPGQDFRPLIQASLDSGTINNVPNALTPNGNTSDFLKSLWADAQGDIQKFESLLEKWFDDTMERAAGWYKQYTQVVLLGVGLVIAWIFNVDTLLIADKLSSNPKLTAMVVQQADAFVKAHPNLNEEIKKMDPQTATDLKEHRDLLFAQAKTLLDKDVKSINQLIGLGWECANCDATVECKWFTGNGWLGTGRRPKGSEHYFLSLVGWFLTALAISLGAPFWFDLLNKLMKLRSSTPSASSDPGGNEKTVASSKTIKSKG